MTENPQFNVANRLNDRFRNGAYVWNQENLRLLRRIPRPICIDVDGVLVSYYHTYQRGVEDDRVYYANPEAEDALKELTDIGIVVITTGNNSAWDRRQQVFVELGLWHPGMIMIDASNLRAELSLEKRGLSFIYPKSHEPTRTYYNMDQKRRQIIDEYLRRRGWTEETFIDDGGERYSVKALAAAFNKSYDIPIIDDTRANTHTLFNTSYIPGMFGLLVREFPENQYHYDEMVERMTLLQAVERVRLYYANL